MVSVVQANLSGQLGDFLIGDRLVSFQLGIQFLVVDLGLFVELGVQFLDRKSVV